MLKLYPIVLTLFTVSCISTVPETGRKQLTLFSTEKENSLGYRQFEIIKRKKKISKNARYNSMLKRSGRRLAKVIPLQNAKWEFVVFNDPTPNAFALPGGKVGVHTGMFKIAKNESQLAAVVGHEIAHVVARHSGEGMSQKALTRLALNGLAIATKSPSLMQTAGLGADLLNKGFSRSNELEADKLGMIYMARAGYNPKEALNLWINFAKAKASMPKIPEILRTHPLDSKRIAQIKYFLPEAMRVYNRR